MVEYYGAGASMSYPRVPMCPRSFLRCVFTEVKIIIDVLLHSVLALFFTIPYSRLLCLTYFGSCRRYPRRLLVLLVKYCIIASWSSGSAIWLPWTTLTKRQATLPPIYRRNRARALSISYRRTAQRCLSQLHHPRETHLLIRMNIYVRPLKTWMLELIVLLLKISLSMLHGTLLRTSPQ